MYCRIQTVNGVDLSPALFYFSYHCKRGMRYLKHRKNLVFTLMRFFIGYLKGNEAKVDAVFVCKAPQNSLVSFEWWNCFVLMEIETFKSLFDIFTLNRWNILLDGNLNSLYWRVDMCTLHLWLVTDKWIKYLSIEWVQISNCNLILVSCI